MTRHGMMWYGIPGSMVWYYDIHTLVCTKCIFPIRCINNIFAPLLQISPRFGNRDQGSHSGHSDSSPLSAKVQTCLQFDRQSTPAFSSLVGSRLIVRTHAIYLSIYLSRGALCSPFLQSKKKTSRGGARTREIGLLVVTRFNLQATETTVGIG